MSQLRIVSINRVKGEGAIWIPGRLEQRILENAAEIVCLHSRIHETLAGRRRARESAIPLVASRRAQAGPWGAIAESVGGC